MVKKLACFFTGGFTESGALQYFISKIDQNIVVKQFCPNKAMKRRGVGGKPQLVKDVSGLTGSSLIRYVYNYIDTYWEDLQEFDAILIEDDMDDRFFECKVPGDLTTKYKCRNREYIDYCDDIRKTIRKKMNRGENYPVFLMYASPEIETWFLADWLNSFGTIYGPKGKKILSTEANNYFSVTFRKYTNREILKQYKDNPEAYGYFEGVYKKLSSELQESLEGDYKVSICKEDYYGISKCRELVYSKQKHGDMMLRSIEPLVVRKKCIMFFAEVYDDIKKLSVSEHFT